MKKALGVLGLVWAVAAGAQNPVIVSFPPTGNLTWENPTNGVLRNRVEWASHADGPWSPFASTAHLDDIAPTGAVMSAAVPMFYRIVAEELPPAPYMVVDLSEGPAAASYPVTVLAEAPPGGWTDEYKTTKLVLRRIPAGTFLMGSHPSELGRGGDEAQRQVTLTKEFFIGVFQVTQKQWERVMGDWPSRFTNTAYRETRPLENRSWDDIRGGTWPGGQPAAETFMHRIGARAGVAFDLPTEAQWEYACRAGTSTALNSGENLTSMDYCPNLNAVGRYWYNGDPDFTWGMNTDGGTDKVGNYLPNPWGLYDMHGNVWEWCLDWYAIAPLGTEDPVGADTGPDRVSRGGGWVEDAFRCRSAARNYNSPSYQIHYLGFRLSKTLP